MTPHLRSRANTWTIVYRIYVPKNIERKKYRTKKITHPSFPCDMLPVSVPSVLDTSNCYGLTDPAQLVRIRWSSSSPFYVHQLSRTVLPTRPASYTVPIFLMLVEPAGSNPNLGRCTDDYTVFVSTTSLPSLSLLLCQVSTKYGKTLRVQQVPLSFCNSPWYK